ncbi:MAG: hypothetical protein HZB71_04790 [Betaproteobacteria bacterium]|nr:hypothetical protein [Betaproteobacteria bacterium]
MTHYNDVNVSLIAGDTNDQVALTFVSADGKTLVLTPSQARSLATDLIAAVNRAEVKSRLKSSPTLMGLPEGNRARLAMAA